MLNFVAMTSCRQTVDLNSHRLLRQFSTFYTLKASENHLGYSHGMGYHEFTKLRLHNLRTLLTHLAHLIA